MIEIEQKIETEINRYLRGAGLLDERTPECPDLEQLWQPIGKAYLPDGLHEFNSYPLVSLGWIMFVGMALAQYWDEDWEKYSAKSAEEIYTSLRDARGFDNMDDYILQDVLHLDATQAERESEIAGKCASIANHALLTSGIEPGTTEAAKAYLAALHILYLTGIRRRLTALGYKMTPLS